MIQNYINQQSHKELKQSNFYFMAPTLIIKKVKLYILKGGQEWQEFLTGYLSLVQQQQKSILKILIQDQNFDNNKINHPFILKKQQDGLNLIIFQNSITTIEKPQEQIIYIWIKQYQQTLSISFMNGDYCDLIWDQLTLLKESSQQEKTWTRSSIPFLMGQIKNSIAYVDFVFSSKEKITEFIFLFKEIEEENNPDNAELLYSFFTILKHVFLRGQIMILKILVEEEFFNPVLQILALNTFNDQVYDYRQKYKQMTKVINHLDIQDQDILDAYNCNTRVRFIKDCAICMFTQPITDLVLNSIINQNNLIIIQKFIQQPINLQILEGLSIRDHKAFLVTFTEIIQILKSVPDDYQNKLTKDNLYNLLTKNRLQVLSISIAQQLTGKNIPTRIFQKWLDMMTYLIGYNWNEAELWIMQIAQKKTVDYVAPQNFWDLSVRNILKPLNTVQPKKFQKLTQNQKQQIYQKSNLMKTLTAIFKQNDFGIKHSTFQFAKNLIQPTDYHNNVSCRLKWFVFENFILNTFQVCNNKDYLEMYLTFMIDFYQMEPIRTRKILIECDVLPKISKMFKNKYIIIMALKLLKIMIQKEDQNAFAYLSYKKVFNDIRKVYIKCKNNKNILNSTFLSILKMIEKVQKQETKDYLAKIFFPKQEQNSINKFQSSQLISSEEKIQKEISIQNPLKIKTKMIIEQQQQLSQKNENNQSEN